MQIPKFKIRCSAIHEIMTPPKKKADVLSVTAKSYCEKWLKEQLYSRREDISDRKIRKGIICEDEAIAFVDPETEKNTKSFQSEYLTGCCDVNLPEMIRDIKSSWDEFTFPLLKTEVDKKYWWQGQGYMIGYNKKKYDLCYVLINTPDRLLYNYEDPVDYDHLPRELRIKHFYFDRDESVLGQIIEKVEHCREYINKLIEGIGK